MATATPATSFLDPGALMAIRNLDLRARAIVEGFWHGIHRSPYHGFSVEFTEYRPYAPGDDPRYLDWKLAARTDRYYIKKFEDETNLRCYLVVDQSRSMMFGSKAWKKLDYARTLAATLQVAAVASVAASRDNARMSAYDHMSGFFAGANPSR